MATKKRGGIAAGIAAIGARARAVGAGGQGKQGFLETTFRKAAGIQGQRLAASTAQPQAANKRTIAGGLASIVGALRARKKKPRKGVGGRAPGRGGFKPILAEDDKP